jgi:putative transposase
VGREGADPESRHHRRPVGEDDRKRGPTGYDAGKKVKGRKRHLVVDTLGLVLAVVVHSAGIQDLAGARLVLPKLAQGFPRLAAVLADAGYRGAAFAAWVAAVLHVALQRTHRPPRPPGGLGPRGFQVLRQRWIVERTFGWFGRYRRLSKDYEQNPRSSEAWIYCAMIHLMVRRLAT